MAAENRLYKMNAEKSVFVKSAPSNSRSCFVLISTRDKGREMATLFYFLADQFTLPLFLPRLSLISSSPYPPHLTSSHITLFPDLFIASSIHFLIF